MILEYHRPTTLESALALLRRSEPLTLPLGGGTVLSRQRERDIAVVDLQALGLNTIEREGQLLRIGAAATLQQLFDCPELPAELSDPLRGSLRIEAGQNLRRAATLGGTVHSANGRSPLLAALLALDPRLVWATQSDPQPLGDFLALRRAQKPDLLLELRFALNIRLSVETVGRSPVDQPLLIVAVGHWPSGRTRVVLGGFGSAPVLALDGPQPGGAVEAVREVYRTAGDEWAGADYRAAAAAALVERILAGGTQEVL